MRALFRRPDGRSFETQRRRLKERVAARLPPGRSPPDLAHVYLVELAPGVPLAEARSVLARDPHVAYVQQDHDHTLDQLGPVPEPIPGIDDPFLYSSGSWGQSFEDLWGLWRVRAPAAWAISRGAGVVVAVVDTGLDYHHPDIADNVWVNPGEDLDGNGRVDDDDWNGIDDDDNGFIDDLRGFDFANSEDADRDGDYDGPDDTSDPDPFDDWGHGTHVAGIIAAVAGNGVGIAGVAPEARIMAIKGFRLGESGRDSDLWRGVLYAAENGARVINTSWSCNPHCPENPLAEEIVALVHAMGVVIVTSAGNRSTDVVFNSPEHLRETITVASSGEDDRPSASFTNRGWLVDLAAPGGGPSDDLNVRIARRNILSLRSSADLSAEFATVGEGYWRTSGTSMAAPHVAGAVALLLSANPELGYEEIRRILRESAVDTGPAGHDYHMGAGRLDVLAALTHPPLPDLRAAIDGPRQGGRHRPGAGRVIDIEGSAAGADFASFEVSVGLGNDPDAWEPLVAATTGPVEAGLLARWDLTDVTEGTYVVRLEVTGSSGARYREFAVLSVERNDFVRVSPPGPPAGAPSISGKLVVWESKRDAPENASGTEDLNLFVSRVDGQRHALVTDAPGEQKLASISGHTISWMDSRNELDRAEIFGCSLDKKGCGDFRVSQGETVTLPPASTPRWIFWIDSESGTNDLRECGVSDGGCSEAPTGLEERTRSFLRGDGQSLVWVEPGGGVGFCRVDAASGRCDARSPSSPIWPTSRMAHSGELLAWVTQVSFRNRASLQLCRFDGMTGECEPLEVARDVGDATPTLSGNRLVWDAALGSEASDVFFCEFDRVRQRCPVQRITAHHAPQRASAIDGRRVVWEDERNGPAEIHGISLPALAPLRDLRVAAGRHTRIVVRQMGGADNSRLDLAVETSAGGDPDALGVRFRELPGRWARGVFSWRPGRDQVGRHAFTFSGTSPNGLVTRQTIVVEVVASPAKGSGQRAGTGGSRTGKPAR